MNIQAHDQLGLFDQQAALSLSGEPASNPTPVTEPSPWCSELILNGRAEHCLHLLAPMLKLLSEQQEQRWLALVSRPNHSPCSGCAKLA